MLSLSIKQYQLALPAPALHLYEPSFALEKE